MKLVETVNVEQLRLPFNMTLLGRRDRAPARSTRALANQGTRRTASSHNCSSLEAVDSLALVTRAAEKLALVKDESKDSDISMLEPQDRN